MRDLVRALMALLSSTRDADRRERRTRAVVEAADRALDSARDNLAPVVRHATDLDRMNRLYAERMADRAGGR